MRTEPVERGPTALSRALGVGAGALGVVAAATGSATGATVALAGLLALGLGLVRRSHGAVSVGATTMLGGVLYAGLGGAAATMLLVGVGATVVAWDLSGFAIDLGAQLGEEADVRRLEAVHALASAAVAAVTAGLGYAVFVTATGGQPVAALLLLLLAGMLLVATLDG